MRDLEECFSLWTNSVRVWCIEHRIIQDLHHPCRHCHHRRRHCRHRWFILIQIHWPQSLAISLAERPPSLPEHTWHYHSSLTIMSNFLLSWKRLLQAHFLDLPFIASLQIVCELWVSFHMKFQSAPICFCSIAIVYVWRPRPVRDTNLSWGPNYLQEPNRELFWAYCRTGQEEISRAQRVFAVVRVDFQNQSLC